MPEINEMRKFKRHDGNGTETKIWEACEDCGKERWILNSQWKRGQCKVCHSCYLKNHSKLEWWRPHYREDNARWNGGRILQKDGYVSILLDAKDPFYSMGCPRKKGYTGRYVLEHRLVMAKAIGRCLQSWEIVHHKDGNRSNNNLTNLELSTRGEHKMSYKDGYEQGFKDGIKYASLVNPNTGYIDVQRSI
jgi:hypothetical protein